MRRKKRKIKRVESLKKGKRLLVFGPSQSGKTYYTTQLFFDMSPEQKKRTHIVVVSPTAMMQPRYVRLGNEFTVRFLPVASPKTSEAIRKIVKAFQRMRRRKNLFIVIDDQGENTFLTHAKKDNFFNYLQITAPHMGTNMIVQFQKVSHAPKVYRVNAEKIILFKVNSDSDKKLIREDFIPGLSKEELETLWRTVFKKPYDYLEITRTATDPILKRNGSEKIDLTTMLDF